ncbi:MAG TPA: hypothetical protein VGC57_09300 [Cellulomonas sp.]
MTWIARARTSRDGHRRPGRSVVPGTGPVLSAAVPAALAALASAAALLGGTWLGVARVLVHQCVRLDGPIGFLGVRLQLLQAVADCPDGTLAVTPGGAQGVVLAFSLAIPALAAWTALGAVGAALVALVARGARTAGRVLRTVVHRLPDLVATRPVRTPRTVLRPRWARPLPSAAPGARHPRRGPPLALA